MQQSSMRARVLDPPIQLPKSDCGEQTSQLLPVIAIASSARDKSECVILDAWPVLLLACHLSPHNIFTDLLSRQFSGPNTSVTNGVLCSERRLSRYSHRANAFHSFCGDREGNVTCQTAILAARYCCSSSKVPAVKFHIHSCGGHFPNGSSNERVNACKKKK